MVYLNHILAYGNQLSKLTIYSLRESSALKASPPLSKVEKLPLSMRPYGRNTYEKHPAKSSHQHRYRLVKLTMVVTKHAAQDHHEVSIPLKCAAIKRVNFIFILRQQYFYYFMFYDFFHSCLTTNMSRLLLQFSYYFWA